MRGGWLGALVCFGACGFAGAPRENPAIPPDGFGPYEERGPVALCQGGVALRAIGPDASGFCVSRAAAAAVACAEDADCGSRERCSCGRCVVPYCTGSEACRSDETCLLASGLCGQACAVDSDCTGETACDRGRCAQRCSALGDCQRGESCSRLRGVCVAIACASDDDCAPDERCEAQRARRELAEPAIVDRDGELLLFVEDRGANAILRGHGSNAGAFELEVEPLVEDAAAPAPLLEDADLVLYFVRADRSALLRVAAADAEPGPSEIVLQPQASWEGGVIDAPSAVRMGSRTVIAYEADGGIGFAAEQGGAWVGSAQPVVTAATLEDPVLWREVSHPGSPMLLFDHTALGEPRLRLWVDARGAEGASTIVGEDVLRPPLNDSIASLVSLDGGSTFTPSPFNPTFARVAELGRYKAESDPWVLETAGGYRLWFVGADVEAGTPEGLGLAVSGP